MSECYGYGLDCYRHEFIMVYDRYRRNRQCYGANPKYGYGRIDYLLCEPDGIGM